jgi:CRISPR system Cascade subunit CasE
MFLSHLPLNPRSRQVRREVAEPYEMHRTLLRGFPATPSDERILFRVDESRESGRWAALVQSRATPDWTHLSALPGYLLGPPQYKAFDLAFAAGQRLRFRLRANPTVKRDGKRVGLLTEDAQRGWLDRKSGESGFVVLGVQVVREGFATGRKPDGDHGHVLTHLGVRYDGLLKVIDPGRLLEALRSGIGSGKAFGFGLLSLAKDGG